MKDDAFEQFLLREPARPSRCPDVVAETFDALAEPHIGVFNPPFPCLVIQDDLVVYTKRLPAKNPLECGPEVGAQHQQRRLTRSQGARANFESAREQLVHRLFGDVRCSEMDTGEDRNKLVPFYLYTRHNDDRECQACAIVQYCPSCAMQWAEDTGDLFFRSKKLCRMTKVRHQVSKWYFDHMTKEAPQGDSME